MDCRDDGCEQPGPFFPRGEFEVIAVAVLRSVLRDGAVDADHVVPQRVEKIGALQQLPAGQQRGGQRGQQQHRPEHATESAVRRGDGSGCVHDRRRFGMSVDRRNARSLFR
jgi:hypothetical protein